MKKKTQKKNAIGLHIIGEIFTKNQTRLKSCELAKNEISYVIKKFSLKELGSFYYQFPESGFTGVVSLVESHVAIHTWPEFGYLTLDVYLCNYSKDNTKTCKSVFDEISKFFDPIKVTKRLIKR